MSLEFWYQFFKQFLSMAFSRYCLFATFFTKLRKKFPEHCGPLWFLDHYGTTMDHRGPLWTIQFFKSISRWNRNCPLWPKSWTQNCITLVMSWVHKSSITISKFGTFFPNFHFQHPEHWNIEYYGPLWDTFLSSLDHKWPSSPYIWDTLGWNKCGTIHNPHWNPPWTRAVKSGP